MSRHWVPAPEYPNALALENVGTDQGGFEWAILPPLITKAQDLLPKS